MNLKLFFILHFFPLALIAQKYGQVWQFGDQAGIDFNYCEPKLISGSNFGFKGCSSVCDSTGELLFYTNSETVWNKQHTLMPNGNLVASGSTLSQVLIVKKPLSANLYYIITTKIQGSGSLTLSYHVVDMSLDNGLGDVSSANNVMSMANVTEQIAATFHSNGTDIWLMAHEYGSNNFLAYRCTPTGINPPIVSGVGPSHITGNSNFNARGEIKFSPNGALIAFNGNGTGTNPATNILCLLDFNRSSGLVSNPRNLPFSGGEYGLSFSPDNSKLYGATWKAFLFNSADYNYLYQFDLSSGNATTIANSKVFLDSVSLNSGSSAFGSLKIGPNGKIYFAKNESGWLGVINAPNLPGLACNYMANGFSLGTKTCKFGLNNYIEYTSYTSSTLITISSSSSITCPGQLALLIAQGASSYTWSPGGATGSNIGITPTVSTTFTVNGNVLSHCPNQALITQSVVSCTGIADEALMDDTDVIVFPNPSSAQITIQSHKAILIDIVNQTGRLVRSFHLTGGIEDRITLHDLDSGMYFLVGSTVDKQVRKKIIVSR